MNRPARVLFVLLLMFAVSAQAAVSPRLEQALASEDFVWQAEDGTYTVWVFFKDKGLNSLELDRALDAAEANLNEKTAWRRAKVRAPGQRLTDAGDLDLHVPYLDLVRATGADLRRQSRWLNAASFQATSGQIRELGQLDCVLRVDLVSKFKRPALPTGPVESPADKNEASRGDIDYGGNLAAMEQFNVPEVHAMGINGQGVIIGMLDTGFHTAHEALTDIPVIAAYDFLNDDDNVDNEPGDPSNAKDHGTMTMSTAVGYRPGSHVAPAFGASVVLAKTESVDLEIPIEEDNWVAGMEWVESHGADIVSSSLGYTDWYTWEDLDGATAVTTIAADLAVARGMVVVNSAGNDRGTDWNHIIAPSDGFNVIAVGAVTSSGNYSSFSSPGPSYDGRIKPDVAALGSSNHVADPNNDTGYTNASGTSFSCPLTSGVVALILSRAPNLTPLQVRDALRETASQAQTPDNDYGWGLIDAHAAVTYFGPNFSHTPLPDTEDTVGPYGLGMMITDRIGLADSTAKVWYRANGGPWQETPIWPTGGGPVSYFADIPGQPADTVVDYYLEASSLNDITTRLPDIAPDEFFSFRVGQDVTPPQLTHTPLRDQALIQWPPTVTCQVTDNLGVDRVEMSFTHNGGPEVGPYLFDNLGLGAFALEFPLPAQEVAYGDVLSYTLTTIDGAAEPNTALSGPHSFQIIETLGLILILDDNPGTVLDVKIDESQKDKPLLPPVAGRSSSGTIAAWLLDAGYVADVIPAAGVTEADFEGYDVVILSAGNNTSPVADAALRQALRERAASGGKIIIEGGEVGYDALNYPGYPDFASQVLHGVIWDSDNAGDLAVATGMANHPLVNTPHLMPFQIILNYGFYGDEDAVKPAADAYTVLVPLSHQGDGGIIIYDDNPSPQSAQILYLAFNIEAIELPVAPQLLENAVAYLMAQESPPTSGISGRVTLGGQDDHSGVLVDLGEGHSALTAADGLWSFTDLYAGSYSVVATKEGWSADRRDIVLEDGQMVSDVNFTLSPILVTEYRDYPNLTIPDGSPSGVTTTITVPEAESGPIANVSVDVYIQHEWIGDLTVVLSSPQGTSVVLHNRSGGEDTNILGNWPETRPVDGPGTLEDFLGENNAGAWTLFLSDAVNIDEGQLTMWGLNFSIPQAVSAVPAGLLPALTRLHPNVPNPFNPATEIRFDLARSGKVQLDIFDVRGRRVRRLVDEQMPAGVHSLRWDGRDQGGRTVSSGTYLYRLRAGEVVQERKMLLVR